MDKVLTVEEKIRRAEEIYQRRRQGEARPVAKVSVNDKKDIKLLRKMILQILICLAIYFFITMIQNSQSIFSEDFLRKANEILSYDTNFVEVYGKIKEQIMGFIKTEEKDEKQEEEKQQETPQEKEPSGEIAPEEKEEEAQGAIGGAEEPQQEKKIEDLSEEEQQIQKIKNTTSFIKPVEGTISSPYGQRDTATGSVPKNHTGTDIAANLGTKIIAATDGEVVLASEEGGYRKTFKNSNWGS